MARRMSCALTVKPVLERTKTVTRRRADSWLSLAVGDTVVLVERSQGLARGETQVVLATVEITDVRIESLDDITDEDVAREGFPGWNAEGFAKFWRATHGIPEDAGVLVRRIEWTYLEV